MTLLVNERVLAGGDAGAEVRLLAGVQAVKVRTGADPATVTRILIEEAYAPAKFSPLRWEQRPEALRITLPEGKPSGYVQVSPCGYRSIDFSPCRYPLGETPSCLWKTVLK